MTHDHFLGGVIGVAKHLGKSRQTIHRWRWAGTFPAPDGATPCGDPDWKVSTVDAFMRANLFDDLRVSADVISTRHSTAEV